MKDAQPKVQPLTQATEAQIEALAHFAERSFRDAFGKQNSTDDMNAYAAKAFSKSQVRSELEDEDSIFLVSSIEGRLAGYGKLVSGSECRFVDAARPIELQRLYVEPTLRSRRIGALLMGECLQVARRGEHDVMWLGVWEENRRAIEFYARWGFARVGDHTFHLGSDPQQDDIMSLDLGNV